MNMFSCGNWLSGSFMPSIGRRVRRNVQKASFAADVELLETRKLLTVTNHGGALLTNVETQGVYLGSDWQTTSTLTTQKGQLDQFLSSIVSGAYMDMLTNAGYGVGRGTSSAGVIDNISLNKTSGITDASIQQDIQAMITAGQLQKPDANRLYVVYVEPGVVIHLGNDSSATTFLGYHGAFAGRTSTGTAADIHYAVIAYPGGVNPSPSSQGFASAFNEQTAVTSHELAESVTDPNVNYKSLTWYDDQHNGEVGDLTRVTVTLNGYTVQEIVDKNDQPMNPNTTTTTSLTAPTNLTATALSSTSVSLSWSAGTGTQGYRVYQVNGSQLVLVATLSATATSTQINGLTAGSSVSFKVQAYNGSTVANSSVVSVTLPMGNLGTPNLSARVLSSNSIQLTWSAVNGAQGYRLYWIDGTTRHLMGTIPSSITTANILGLSSGARYSFQIEAFQGSNFQDSAIVSATTQARNGHSGGGSTHEAARPAGYVLVRRHPNHN